MGGDDYGQGDISSPSPSFATRDDLRDVLRVMEACVNDLQQENQELRAKLLASDEENRALNSKLIKAQKQQWVAHRRGAKWQKMLHDGLDRVCRQEDNQADAMRAMTDQVNALSLGDGAAATATASRAPRPSSTSAAIQSTRAVAAAARQKPTATAQAQRGRGLPGAPQLPAAAAAAASAAATAAQQPSTTAAQQPPTAVSTGTGRPTRKAASAATTKIAEFAAALTTGSGSRRGSKGQTSGSGDGGVRSVQAKPPPKRQKSSAAKTGDKRRAGDRSSPRLGSSPALALGDDGEGGQEEEGEEGEDGDEDGSERSDEDPYCGLPSDDTPTLLPSVDKDPSLTHLQARSAYQVIATSRPGRARRFVRPRHGAGLWACFCRDFKSLTYQTITTADARRAAVKVMLMKKHRSKWEFEGEWEDYAEQIQAPTWAGDLNAAYAGEAEERKVGMVYQLVLSYKHAVATTSVATSQMILQSRPALCSHASQAEVARPDAPLSNRSRSQLRFAGVSKATLSCTLHPCRPRARKQRNARAKARRQRTNQSS